jgi:UDP-N-acetylglucosamine:LPS N-acetylglucosamine transferase
VSARLTEGPPRVLVATASVGEGHDAPARVLARSLAADASVEVLDVLTVSGALIRAAAEGGPRTSFGSRAMRWLFDAEYLLFARLGPTRRLGQYVLYRLSARRLLEAVRGRDPDVVVATYPIASEVLGRLRAAGRLRIPLCSAITDLAGLHYWAHPGCDLHLVTHPESIAEVERIAGPGSAVAVRGLTAPAFLDPPDREQSRRRLGLPAAAAVVTVSGGGWGVGDVPGAVGVARGIPGVVVVALCGRSDDLVGRLEHAYAGDEQVRVLGFTDEMAELLAATDVLVHSTAGLTVLEAYMLGCRVVSFGLGVGHIRVNNEAFARFGIAEVVSSRRGLRPALERALAGERTARYPEFAGLPEASAAILELAAAAAGSPPGRPAGGRRPRPRSGVG